MDDREIVRLLTAGEPEGLDRLRERHGPMLGYIVRGMLADPREQEECLSDIELLVWRKIGSYDPEKGSLAVWLTALARNRARNRLRDGARRGRRRSSPRSGPTRRRGRRSSCSERRGPRPFGRRWIDWGRWTGASFTGSTTISSPRPGWPRSWG